MPAVTWASPSITSNTNAHQSEAKVANLKTEGGRQKLCACIMNRIPLSGQSSHGNTSAGIDECRAVVEAMEKMKALSGTGLCHIAH